MLDPCSDPPKLSNRRFFVFLPTFLVMMPGSLVLFMWLSDHPYGVQLASMVGYTAAVILYTFSANRGLPRYLFTCPVVHGQLYRLAVRHLGFLIALFIIETVALHLRPSMPPSWFVARGRNMPPFIMGLALLCGSLLLTEVITNRSLLGRAHNLD